jgi:hypothetical protein
MWNLNPHIKTRIQIEVVSEQGTEKKMNFTLYYDDQIKDKMGRHLALMGKMTIS